MAATAASLASDLANAAGDFVEVIGSVRGRGWLTLPAAGTWSVGKEAEHVADALAYHQWIVSLTIGAEVSSRRPTLERAAMTTSLTPKEAAAVIRTRATAAAALVGGLTDKQLRLPTRPPRAKAAPLAATIERVMIGHIRVHRVEVAAKLQALTS